MADVVITVMIDGKQAFVAGAANTPDPQACAVAALQLGAAHFQAVKAASTIADAPKKTEQSV